MSLLSLTLPICGPAAGDHPAEHAQRRIGRTQQHHHIITARRGARQGVHKGDTMFGLLGDGKLCMHVRGMP